MPRAQGLTVSERYLQSLCERTFLKALELCAAISKDRGAWQRQTGVGKELCDLLVVFEDHIIIFSDKDIAFPDSGELWKDWNLAVSEGD